MRSGAGATTAVFRELAERMGLSQTGAGVTAAYPR
jgi:hypothetical protein